MAMPISVTSGQPTGLPDPSVLPTSQGARRRTALSRLTTAIRRNRKATVGVALLLLFTLVALFPNLIPHYNPVEIFYGPKCPSCYSRPALVQATPSSAHLLGTDLEGHDVFSQVIVGTRAVLVLAIVTGLLTTLIAMVVGVAAAYLGGSWDSVLNVVTDVLLVIPLFPLLIVIVKYIGQSGNLVLILVLTVTGWSYTARQLRSQAQSLRNRDFLLAARVRGERSFYIIMVEMIPTMTSLLLAVPGAGRPQHGQLGHDAVLGGLPGRAAKRTVPVGDRPRAVHRPSRRRVRAAQLRLRRDRQPGAAAHAGQEAGAQAGIGRHSGGRARQR
jgi:ABC-type dipeptide/oligopeptide/nickel transport system permease subunit